MTARFEQYALLIQCEYCGMFKPCRDEPFGNRPACEECWEQLIGGDDE